MSTSNRALLDPAAVFKSPEEVLYRDDLSSEEKADILCCWAYDARRLEVAEDEGMLSSQPDILDQILQTLRQLGIREHGCLSSWMPTPGRRHRRR